MDHKASVVTGDRLCAVVSARADELQRAPAQRLRGAGLVLWAWPPDEPQAHPPEQLDALLMLGPLDLPSPALRQAWIGLLRRAWRDGATIGLFGGAAELLAAADIAPAGAPLEAPGLFVDDGEPGAGVLDEFVDAVAGGPHPQR